VCYKLLETLQDFAINENTESEMDIVGKSEVDWQENWSFISKSAQAKCDKSAIKLTVPEPKNKVMATIGDE
jgi:hypothetical protein